MTILGGKKRKFGRKRVKDNTLKFRSDVSIKIPHLSPQILSNSNIFYYNLPDSWFSPLLADETVSFLTPCIKLARLIVVWILQDFVWNARVWGERIYGFLKTANKTSVWYGMGKQTTGYSPHVATCSKALSKYWKKSLKGRSTIYQTTGTSVYTKVISLH